MVLYVLRRLPRPLGEDYLLVLTDVGDSVYGHRVARQAGDIKFKGGGSQSPPHKQDKEQPNYELILKEEAYKCVNHKTILNGNHESPGQRKLAGILDIIKSLNAENLEFAHHVRP